MCVEMVIIYKKTLDKKGCNNEVTSDTTSLGPLPAQTMSQGTALFSCGLMEASRWRDMSHSFVHPKPVGNSLDSIWDGPLEVNPEHCGFDVGNPSGSISYLLQDLSLTEPYSTAPPSKRQCRSLSCSDDLGRSTWRPQGSRVWTTVEKRRCHSGGSVQRTSTNFPPMQRSSSFSLQKLHLSPSQSEGMPSPPSSPDSTPDMERRCGPQAAGGLARSRSQPCVMNERKTAVKRRRPEEAHKQRPSLDLAKMTQKLKSFHSLSCPGIAADDHCDTNHTPSNLKNTLHFQNGPTIKPIANQQSTSVIKDSPGNPALVPNNQDSDWTPSNCGHVTPFSTNRKEGEAFWAGRCSMYQLGGELDIEQIERN